MVDETKKSSGATATVFVKEGDEFVRVSTNALTPEGKRGVGATLARAKACEAVSKGRQYCGDVDVLGTPFSACYNPIKGGGGKVIGAAKQIETLITDSQQNAALVEESAAAAASLKHQADQLVQVVTVFRLRGVAA